MSTPRALFWPLDEMANGHSSFPRWRPATLLDLIHQEVAQFYPPTPKALPRIKYKVNRMTRCWDIAIWGFQMRARSSVGHVWGRDVTNDMTIGLALHRLNSLPIGDLLEPSLYLTWLLRLRRVKI